MSLKREMLVDAGIKDKEVLDEIMNAYGSGLENAKTQAKAELQAENEALKEQLKAQTDKVNELSNDKNNSEELKQSLDVIKNDFANYKTESESKIAAIQKTNAIALALKDTKTYDSDVLMKLIDVDSVQLDENGKPILEDTINLLKESKPYLFKEEQEENVTTPKFTVGGNPDGTGGKPSDPFQSIIDGYKK